MSLDTNDVPRMEHVTIKVEIESIKDETEFTKETVHVKEEPEWDTSGDLPVDHEAKYELVLEPQPLQPSNWPLLSQEQLPAACKKEPSSPEQAAPWHPVKFERNVDHEVINNSQVDQDSAQIAFDRASTSSCRQKPAIAMTDIPRGRPTKEQADTDECTSKVKPTCKICNKRFTKSSSLKSHQRIHTGEKPYSCDICKKQFTELCNLKTHQRVHTGAKPYSCELCGKEFTQSSNLKTHMLIHTGRKSYTCEICDKKFTQLGNLRMHNRIHTGVKPYTCEICDKEFTGTSDLKRHAQTHTGLKPYSCEVCKKNFAQSSKLRLHERIHTGLKPYSCDICEKEFTLITYLKIHRRSHTGEKPYSCEICDKKFTQSTHLNRHKRVHI